MIRGDRSQSRRQRSFLTTWISLNKGWLARKWNEEVRAKNGNCLCVGSAHGNSDMNVQKIWRRIKKFHFLIRRLNVHLHRRFTPFFHPIHLFLIAVRNGNQPLRPYPGPPTATRGVPSDQTKSQFQLISLAFFVSISTHLPNTALHRRFLCSLSAVWFWTLPGK